MGFSTTSYITSYFNGVFFCFASFRDLRRRVARPAATEPLAGSEVLDLRKSNSTPTLTPSKGLGAWWSLDG